MCVDDIVFDTLVEANNCAALISWLSGKQLYIFKSYDEYLDPEFWVSTEP